MGLKSWLSSKLEDAVYGVHPVEYLDTDALAAKALSGDAKAQFRLALQFTRGIRVPVECETIVNWLEEHSIVAPEASHLLGYIFYKKGDLQNALGFYERAAEQGYMPAQFRLGLHLTKSIDDEDKKKGIRFLEMAGNRGHIYAKRELAIISWRRSGRLSGLPRLARELLAWMAEAGRIAAADPSDERLAD